MNRPVITIGSFDGVHLGHQFLLREVVKKAKHNDSESIVITYKRDPQETINKDSPPYLLSEYKKREELIYKLGIDKIYYFDFNEVFSKLNAQSFLKKYLLKTFSPQVIVAGYDTHFGINRSGNIKILKEFAPIYDYEVMEIRPLTISEQVISSSLIRQNLINDNLEIVNKLLGRSFSVIGTVVDGNKLGHTIGFPTINLKLLDDKKLFPLPGVYFTSTLLNGKHYFGGTNIGKAPTVSNDTVLMIENHLLDFNEDVYGQEVEISFIKKLREEQKFNSLIELAHQIQTDMNIIRSMTYRD